QQSQASSPASQSSALSNFFSSILTPLGFGAYHTSIDCRGFRYQFGANMGIARTSSPGGGGETADSLRFLPPNGAYRESIVLGQTWCEQGEINAIIQRMRDGKFKGEDYHLANRNCNHFCETFATALIFGNDLLDSNKSIKLEKFPAWINRLARTGTSMGLDDGKACDVLEEAKLAAGLKGKVGWGLTTSAENKSGTSNAANRSQKKQLTEKQKAALAKLKKGSK
ncbi:hypothetical protein ACHAXR_012200, partial [Thalassiosira sp. AJA248-18]